MTIVRNPASFAKLLVPPTTFEMGVTIATNALYTLADNIAIGTLKLITVNGRLNCATYTIGGGGGVPVTSATNPNGTLGIGAAGGGVGATVITTGTNTYADGSNIDYYAAGIRRSTRRATQPPPCSTRAAAGEDPRWQQDDHRQLRLGADEGCARRRRRQHLRRRGLHAQLHDIRLRQCAREWDLCVDRVRGPRL